MAEITQLLDRWSHGDADAFEALMPLVYDELRKLARHHLHGERADHTLQPTALVHEAYMRLAGLREARPVDRTHFYGVASRVMRRVLVDHARQHRADKRGGPDAERVPLAETIAAPGDIDESTRLDLISLDEALEAFSALSPVRAKVVELRYFGGLSIEETAAFLHIAPTTAKRHWRYARAWLLRRMAQSSSSDSAEEPTT
jgi:RNA polymerase sigma factor (TIGR02999 family)